MQMVAVRMFLVQNLMVFCWNSVSQGLNPYASSHLLAVLYFFIQINDIVPSIIPGHDVEHRVEHALLR